MVTLQIRACLRSQNARQSLAMLELYALPCGFGDQDLRFSVDIRDMLVVN